MGEMVGCKMTRKTKSECENELVEHILKIGIKSCMQMYGGGRNRNDLYYQFTLKDGTQKHWTNMSDENLKKLGLWEGDE